MKRIIKITLIYFLFTNSLYGQKVENLYIYLKQIENVEIFDLIFLMPELNKIDINDSSFFNRYKKSINSSMETWQQDNTKFLYNIQLKMIHYTLDTILNSKNKIWNKKVFNKLKRITPYSNDTNFSDKNLDKIFNFQTDETNVKNLIFYTLFLSNSEKLINYCHRTKKGKIELSNWQEEYYPFSDCNYLAYQEVINRQKKHLKILFKNSKNQKLKNIIYKIQLIKPNC